MGQKPIEGSNPSLSATRHVNSRRYHSDYCRSHEAGIRTRDMEKGGSTKSPKAILDDAHASPEGRGPKARVNPSLSASRPVNSRRFRSDYCDSDNAGITPARAAPKGRGAERRVILPLRQSLGKFSSG